MNFKIQENTEKLKITVKLINGDIKLSKSSESELNVDFPDIVKTNIEEFFEIKFEENHLFIREKSRDELSEVFRKNKYSSDVIINVPEFINHISSKLNSVNGDITISDFEITGTIKTTNGDILINNAKLFIDGISLINGDAVLKNSTGYFIINNINGDIKIIDCIIEKSQIKVQNGDISINSDFKLIEDGFVKTSFGGIEIYFKSYETEKILSLHSITGPIDINGNFTTDRVKIKKIGYEQFGTFPKIEQIIKNALSSIPKGFKEPDITINLKDDTSKSNNTDNKNNDAINKILDMLDQGKISAEQAIELISQIKSN